MVSTLEILVALTSTCLPKERKIRLPRVVEKFEYGQNVYEITLANGIFYGLDMTGLHRIENHDLLDELLFDLGLDATNSWRFGRFVLSTDQALIAALKISWPYGADYFDVRALES